MHTGTVLYSNDFQKKKKEVDFLNEYSNNDLDFRLYFGVYCTVLVLYVGYSRQREGERVCL